MDTDAENPIVIGTTELARVRRLGDPQTHREVGAALGGSGGQRPTSRPIAGRRAGNA